MKVAKIIRKKTVAIETIDSPKIEDNEVLVKVKITGICGSDLHLYQDTHAFRRPPAILGHEIAGIIVEVGKSVKSHKIGDRVTIEPHLGCGLCKFCEDGLVNICIKKKVPGTPDWIGTFVEYFNADERTLHKIEDKIGYEMGVMVEPLAVAIHAINRCTNKNKDCIVILGAGTIGLLTQVVAKELGYKTIITTDPAPFNRELSLKLGATVSIDPLTEDINKTVADLTENKCGADVTVVCAGASNILDQASEVTKKRGEICIVSMITEKIPFYCYSVVFKEQTIKGSMTYQTEDFVKATKMINEGLDLNLLITHKFDIDNTSLGLKTLSEKKENVGKVLIVMD